MAFELHLTPLAQTQLQDLEHDVDQKDLVKLRKVRKCLGLLEANPRHPGLHAHIFSALEGVNGEKVWEVYVENNVPSAWRVFWHYGPGRQVITVLAITPHP